jgi:hypothetical protein
VSLNYTPAEHDPHGACQCEIETLREKLAAAERDNAALREAAKAVVKMAPILECNDFHHNRPDWHLPSASCPIETRWLATMQQLITAIGAKQ